MFDKTSRIMYLLLPLLAQRLLMYLLLSLLSQRLQAFCSIENGWKFYFRISLWHLKKVWWRWYRPSQSLLEVPRRGVEMKVFMLIFSLVQHLNRKSIINITTSPREIPLVLASLCGNCPLTFNFCVYLFLADQCQFVMQLELQLAQVNLYTRNDYKSSGIGSSYEKKNLILNVLKTSFMLKFSLQSSLQSFESLFLIW